MSEETAVAAPQNPAWLDERLEQMDQLLFGLLPRAERLSMVAGLESRLQTLLAADLNLEQAAAKRLERPDLPTGNVANSRQQLPIAKIVSPKKRSRIALTAGILGLVALLMLLLCPVVYGLLVPLASMVSEEFAMLLLIAALGILVFTALGSTILGFVGLVRLLINSEKSQGYGWAITGLCSGPLPLLAGSYVLLMVLENL